jgi:hypothetical protein
MWCHLFLHFFALFEEKSQNLVFSVISHRTGIRDMIWDCQNLRYYSFLFLHEQITLLLFHSANFMCLSSVAQFPWWSKHAQVCLTTIHFSQPRRCMRAWLTIFKWTFLELLEKRFDQIFFRCSKHLELSFWAKISGSAMQNNVLF